jgi:hypothetical protein
MNQEMRRISEVLHDALKQALRGAGGTRSGRVNRSVVVNIGQRNSRATAVSVQDTTRTPTAGKARGAESGGR